MLDRSRQLGASGLRSRQFGAHRLEVALHSRQRCLDLRRARRIRRGLGAAVGKCRFVRGLVGHCLLPQLRECIRQRRLALHALTQRHAQLGLQPLLGRQLGLQRISLATQSAQVLGELGDRLASGAELGNELGRTASLTPLLLFGDAPLDGVNRRLQLPRRRRLAGNAAARCRRRRGHLLASGWRRDEQGQPHDAEERMLEMSPQAGCQSGHDTFLHGGGSKNQIDAPIDPSSLLASIAGECRRINHRHTSGQAMDRAGGNHDTREPAADQGQKRPLAPIAMVRRPRPRLTAMISRIWPSQRPAPASSPAASARW